ncbi:MAG TPA: phosphoribosyltransferase family protein, partial [Microbacterium sp.]|nr:phosphoribosyltransferase family protein [Microbacterium sp.]
SRMLREGRAAEPIEGRVAIIVDDGIATGATMRTACAIARARGASHVVVAVPVAAPDALDQLTDADEVVCLCAPRDFMAVGMYYTDFRQTPEEEVVRLLAAAR